MLPRGDVSNLDMRVRVLFSLFSYCAMCCSFVLFTIECWWKRVKSFDCWCISIELLTERERGVAECFRERWMILNSLFVFFFGSLE